jgi:peptide-methionine (S)-S-oxide reductase
MNIQEGIEVATSGGCFVCTEAVFLELEGVSCYFRLHYGKTIDPTTKKYEATGMQKQLRSL